ncbi:VRR-NUC domain-containing protein [Leuconostoc suionicum]|uniref:VRR-NUC domain-containing protein n=1 Tax=Leuconostoc TaxID=1243 RepID=UPI001CC01F4D|nr:MULTISPECIES: VRR-NUC domain-containing protein [Leuconostoc]MBZ1508873.1 VRR-NUC domain-containing protein [Leuconostoc mesenteroides]MBZ1532791.1 VRR-NUC domain-containing protein [Leuconostoc mesenteroides]MDI6497896.1 VRR-NUC domain-containing protein [Leuconostoc suionicum]MDI6499977.1 VRR-NUC domain-containing protein [Leuconostoc suionicum]MDI6502914.1 VRR-NUC domain-containing protein [Leuconostoc suionicum]
MREQQIQNEARIALSKDGHTQFRINTGTVITRDGRPFSSGTPKGFFDLVGYRKQDKQIFFIDMKTKTGRIRDDQIKFSIKLKNDNVIHGIARSPEDALKIVNEGLIGYGLEKYV